jgi:uncharacterized protein (TIGR02246 family)
VAIKLPAPAAKYSDTINGGNMKLAATCAATVLALFLTACSSDTHDADVKALKDGEVQWNQDYASKNVDKIVSHYAGDAVLMAPGMPATTGKDPIRTMLTQMVADPALSLHFEATNVDVAKSGDLGYTRGKYTMDMTDPQTKQVVHDHGSYVTTYRKQPDGTWKAVSDIASSETPSIPIPPPAASTPKQSKGKKGGHKGGKSKH